MKKWLRVGALASVALVATGTARAQTNKLVDGGFEDPTKFTQDGETTPFVGFWEAFDGDGVASATRVTTGPRSGAGHVNLTITNTDNSFAGLFQDVVIPGQNEPAIDFSGWNRNAGGVLDIAAEYRIEFRNASGEVARTGNIVPTLTANYTRFTLRSRAPREATIARFVYAVQSFGPGDTNTGTVFLDDLSVIIPEPASAVMACFGVLAMMRMRSRQE